MHIIAQKMVIGICFQVLQAFQARALEVNEKTNAVVEFLEDALARAKYLVLKHSLIMYMTSAAINASAVQMHMI